MEPGQSGGDDEKPSHLGTSRSAETMGRFAGEHKPLGQRPDRYHARRSCVNRRHGLGDHSQPSQRGPLGKSGFNTTLNGIRISKSCTTECEILRPDGQGHYQHSGASAYSSIYSDTVRNSEYDMYPVLEDDGEYDLREHEPLSDSTILGMDNDESDANSELFNTSVDDSSPMVRSALDEKRVTTSPESSTELHGKSPDGKEESTDSPRKKTKADRSRKGYDHAVKKSESVENLCQIKRPTDPMSESSKENLSEQLQVSLTPLGDSEAGGPGESQDTKSPESSVTFTASEDIYISNTSVLAEESDDYLSDERPIGHLSSISKRQARCMSSAATENLLQESDQSVTSLENNENVHREPELRQSANSNNLSPETGVSVQPGLDSESSISPCFRDQSSATGGSLRRRSPVRGHADSRMSFKSPLERLDETSEASFSAVPSCPCITASPRSLKSPAKLPKADAGEASSSSQGPKRDTSRPASAKRTPLPKELVEAVENAVRSGQLLQCEKVLNGSLDNKYLLETNDADYTLKSNYPKKLTNRSVDDSQDSGTQRARPRSRDSPVISMLTLDPIKEIPEGGHYNRRDHNDVIYQDSRRTSRTRTPESTALSIRRESNVVKLGHPCEEVCCEHLSLASSKTPSRSEKIDDTDEKQNSVSAETVPDDLKENILDKNLDDRSQHGDNVVTSNIKFSYTKGDAEDNISSSTSMSHKPVRLTISLGDGESIMKNAFPSQVSRQVTQEESTTETEQKPIRRFATDGFQSSTTNKEHPSFHWFNSPVLPEQQYLSYLHFLRNKKLVKKGSLCAQNKLRGAKRDSGENVADVNDGDYMKILPEEDCDTGWPIFHRGRTKSDYFTPAKTKPRYAGEARGLSPSRQSGRYVHRKYRRRSRRKSRIQRLRKPVYDSPADESEHQDEFYKPHPMASVSDMSIGSHRRGYCPDRESSTDDSRPQSSARGLTNEDLEFKMKYYEKLSAINSRNLTGQTKTDPSRRPKRITSQVKLLKEIDDYCNAQSPLETDNETNRSESPLGALDARMPLFNYYVSKLTNAPLPQNLNRSPPGSLIRIRKSRGYVPSALDSKRLKVLSDTTLLRQGAPTTDTSKPGLWDHATRHACQHDNRMEEETSARKFSLFMSNRRSTKAKREASMTVFQELQSKKAEWLNSKNKSMINMVVKTPEISDLFEGTNHIACTDAKSIIEKPLGVGVLPEVETKRGGQRPRAHDSSSNKTNTGSFDNRPWDTNSVRSAKFSGSDTTVLGRNYPRTPRSASAKEKERETPTKLKPAQQRPDQNSNVSKSRQPWQRSEEDTWCYSVNAMLSRAKRVAQENECHRKSHHGFPRPESAKIISPVAGKPYTFLSELLKQDKLERKQQIGQVRAERRAHEKIQQMWSDSQEQRQQFLPPRGTMGFPPAQATSNHPSQNAPWSSQATTSGVASTKPGTTGGHNNNAMSAGLLRIRAQGSILAQDRAAKTQKRMQSRTNAPQSFNGNGTETEEPVKLPLLRIQKPLNFINPDTRHLRRISMKDLKAMVSEDPKPSIQQPFQPKEEDLTVPNVENYSGASSYLLDQHSDTFRYYKHPYMVHRTCSIKPLFGDFNNNSSNSGFEKLHEACIQDNLHFPPEEGGVVGSQVSNSAVATGNGNNNSYSNDLSSESDESEYQKWALENAHLISSENDSFFFSEVSDSDIIPTSSKKSAKTSSLESRSSAASLRPLVSRGSLHRRFSEMRSGMPSIPSRQLETESEMQTSSLKKMARSSYFSEKERCDTLNYSTAFGCRHSTQEAGSRTQVDAGNNRDAIYITGQKLFEEVVLRYSLAPKSHLKYSTRKGQQHQGLQENNKQKSDDDNKQSLVTHYLAEWLPNYKEDAPQMSPPSSSLSAQASYAPDGKYRPIDISSASERSFSVARERLHLTPREWKEGETELEQKYQISKDRKVQFENSSAEHEGGGDEIVTPCQLQMSVTGRPVTLERKAKNETNFGKFTSEERNWLGYDPTLLLEKTQKHESVAYLTDLSTGSSDNEKNSGETHSSVANDPAKENVERTYVVTDLDPIEQVKAEQNAKLEIVQDKTYDAESIKYPYKYTSDVNVVLDSSYRASCLQTQRSVEEEYKNQAKKLSDAPRHDSSVAEGGSHGDTAKDYNTVMSAKLNLLELITKESSATSQKLDLPAERHSRNSSDYAYTKATDSPRSTWILPFIHKTPRPDSYGHSNEGGISEEYQGYKAPINSPCLKPPHTTTYLKRREDTLAESRHFLKTLRATDLAQTLAMDRQKLMRSLDAVVRKQSYAPVFQIWSYDKLEVVPLVLRINHCTASDTEDTCMANTDLQAAPVFYTEDSGGFVDSMYIVNPISEGLYTLDGNKEEDHTGLEAFMDEETYICGIIKTATLARYPEQYSNTAFLGHRAFLVAGIVKTREDALSKLIAIQDQARSSDVSTYFTLTTGWVPPCFRKPPSKVILPAIGMQSQFADEAITDNMPDSEDAKSEPILVSEGKNEAFLPELVSKGLSIKPKQVFQEREPEPVQLPEIQASTPCNSVASPNVHQSDQSERPAYPVQPVIICFYCGDTIKDDHGAHDRSSMMTDARGGDQAGYFGQQVTTSEQQKPEPANVMSSEEPKSCSAPLHQQTEWVVTDEGIAIKIPSDPRIIREIAGMFKLPGRVCQRSACVKAHQVSQTMHQAGQTEHVSQTKHQINQIDTKSKSMTGFPNSILPLTADKATVVTSSKSLPHIRRKEWWSSYLKRFRPQERERETTYNIVPSKSETNNQPVQNRTDIKKPPDLPSHPASSGSLAKHGTFDIAGWESSTTVFANEDEKMLMLKSTWSQPVIPPPFPAPKIKDKHKPARLFMPTKSEYSQHRRNLSQISHSYVSPYYTKKEVRRPKSPVSDSDDSRTSSRISTISGISSTSSSSSESESGSDDSESGSESSASGSEFFNRYADKGGPTSIDDIFKRTLPKKKLPHTLAVLKEEKELEEIAQLGYLRGREGMMPQAGHQGDVGAPKPERSAVVNISEYDMCSDAEEFRELWRQCFPEVDFWDRNRRKKFKKTKIRS